MSRERYLWPPRPSEAVPFDFLLSRYSSDPRWVGQYKWNDSRCLLWWRQSPAGGVEFWSRHKELLDYSPSPEVLRSVGVLGEHLGLKVGAWSAVDCGLLHTRHSHPWLRDKLVIYDVLAINDELLLGESYRARRALLGAIGDWKSALLPVKDGAPVFVGDWVPGCEESILVSRSWPGSEWAGMWGEVQRANEGWVTAHGGVSPVLEGLVVRDMSSLLEPMLRESNNSSGFFRSRVKTRRHVY